MLKYFIPLLMVLAGCSRAEKGLSSATCDRTISEESKYPVAVDPAKVGNYPALVKSGAGYFYDEVLEYRVWLHPEKGAEKKDGGNDYFAAFAQYERAAEFSRQTAGAEEPLVLIRQMKHINEPSPGVFEIVEGERIAEWQVPWLEGTKRMAGSLERFLEEHRPGKSGDPKELQAAREHFQQLSHPSEPDRQRYILDLFLLRLKFAEARRTSDWQAVDAELRRHPSPKDSDSSTFSNLLVGEWGSPRHNYVIRSNGTWSMLPVEPGTTYGRWRIEGNQYYETAEVEPPQTRQYTIILLTSLYFIFTDGEVVFYESRLEKEP